jgi:hypothetical protein
MTFSRALFSLLLVGISISAMAADKPANPPSQSAGDGNPLLGFPSASPPQAGATMPRNPFLDGTTDTDPLEPSRTEPGTFSLSDLNGDVCYTMRSYKVKRTERLIDNQTGLRPYSTCERASAYQVRSAEAKAKDSRDRR